MYVVAYDITDNKERKKVAKVLQDFGERVQKSVWSCDITYEECERLRKRLERLVITTGNIHIWTTKTEPWRVGAEETMPKRAWAHCL
ncbi:MAG: CRISPR-associated endonuclease Cas2 [Desulfovibrionaceae bacterium]|nr:CRISPR-associated endonuclease Cas2 [Desulfovibrionaceae bacterium]